MEIKDLILQLADEIFDETVRFRRHLHRNPELSGQEEKTAAFIKSVLDDWNIPCQTGIGGHGLTALISGTQPGKCIALRADMDALPITEEKDSDYKSLIPGVMHACGHDAHVASLLGTAHILKNLTSHFAGSFKLIFQPSEEVFPGGAIKMISDGALENPPVDAIIGQHVLPQLKSGMVGMKSGKYMASTDEIYLTITGRGGHGATPELNIDPVVIAAQILIALQQIPSRYANPSLPTVLSFGRFIANGHTNIIPDQVKLDGTLRTFDESWRAQVHGLIEKIACGMADSFGASCQVKINKGYPYLVNDDRLTAIAFTASSLILGQENVADLPLRMTAEDFSYFSHKVPGIYYRLGIADPKATSSPNLHTSKFDIDENALRTGCSVMAFTAIKMLEELNK